MSCRANTRNIMSVKPLSIRIKNIIWFYCIKNVEHKKIRKSTKILEKESDTIKRQLKKTTIFVLNGAMEHGLSNYSINFNPSRFKILENIHNRKNDYISHSYIYVEQININWISFQKIICHIVSVLRIYIFIRFVLTFQV